MSHELHVMMEKNLGKKNAAAEESHGDASEH